MFFRSTGIISIITSGHCLCNYHDYEPTASMFCIEHTRMVNSENNQIKIVPSNQHTGPFEKTSPNFPIVNSVYAVFGSNDLDEIQDTEWEALDAYVMSATKRNRKIDLYGDDVYDLGITRIKILMIDYARLKLQPLALPTM